MNAAFDIEQNFRDAWLASSGHDFASRMARRSLAASALQDAALEPVLFELRNEFQAELDLHIVGDTVVDHQADAERYADFVKGIADAVKALTKLARGRDRMSSGLRIAAPMPGSIRVVIRAAAPVELDGAIRQARSETADSESLRTVATLLARAGNSNEDPAVLTALVSQLPAKARTGIRRTAYATVHAKWDFSGELRRPAAPSVPIQVSNHAALVLLEILDAKDVVPDTVRLSGHVDGQRRSIGAMWFEPDHGDSFEAAVLDPGTLDTIAEMAASGERTTAVFDVVEKLSRTGPSATKTYALVSIEPESVRANVDAPALGLTDAD